jgi:hypothetical protein
MFEFKLYSLLEPFEAPFALFLFERQYPQELLNRLVWIALLQLLCVVVFVLDIDIAGIIIVVFFVFKVVPVMRSMRASIAVRC